MSYGADGNAMIDRYDKLGLAGRAGGIAATMVGGAMLFAASAAAQQPQSPPPAAPPVQQAAPPSEPGFISKIGRWFEESTDRVKSSLRGARGTLEDLGGRATGVAKGAADVAKDTAKGAADAAKSAAGVAKDTAKGAADAAKDAADAVARLPRSRVVEGREHCEVAPNGAPDCRVAADTVCKSKGFESGSSLNIQQAQKCPARVWLSRRSSRADECEIVSFVTRAVCQ
jgi:hypothetical protein